MGVGGGPALVGICVPLLRVSIRVLIQLLTVSAISRNIIYRSEKLWFFYPKQCVYSTTGAF